MWDTHIDEVEGPPDTADDLRAIGAQNCGCERPPPAQQLPTDCCAHAASILCQQRHSLTCTSMLSVRFLDDQTSVSSRLVQLS